MINQIQGISMSFMLKNIIATLSLIYLTTTGIHAQQNVIPGKGFENIRIGMKIENVLIELGEPTLISSRKEESTHWKIFGYQPKNAFIFRLEFDNVYLFESDNEFLIWKIYTHKGKIIYINISSYVFENPLHKISIDNKFKMEDSHEKIKKTFEGTPYKKTKGIDYNELLYPKEGILFIFNSTQLKNVHVFNPIKKRKIKKMHDIYQPH